MKKTFGWASLGLSLFCALSGLSFAGESSTIYQVQVLAIHEPDLNRIHPAAERSVTIIFGQPTIKNGSTTGFDNVATLQISYDKADIDQQPLYKKLMNCMNLAHDSFYRQAISFGFNYDATYDPGKKSVFAFALANGSFNCLPMPPVPEGNQLSISPRSPKIPVNSSVSFTVSGGTPPYIYSTTAGAISASGVLTAPPSPRKATVTVKDSGHPRLTASTTVTFVPTLTSACQTNPCVSPNCPGYNANNCVGSDDPVDSGGDSGGN